MVYVFDWIDKIVGTKVFDWIYDYDEKKECYQKTATENLINVALDYCWTSEIPTVLEVLAERDIEKAIELAKRQLETGFEDDAFRAELVRFVAIYDEAYANQFLEANPDVQAVVSNPPLVEVGERKIL